MFAAHSLIHRWVRPRDARREFLELIEPLIQQKLRVLNRSIPKRTLYPDGTLVEVHPAWVQEILDHCDAEIAKIAQMFGNQWTPEEREELAKQDHPPLTFNKIGGDWKI